MTLAPSLIAVLLNVSFLAEVANRTADNLHLPPSPPANYAVANRGHQDRDTETNSWLGCGFHPVLRNIEVLPIDSDGDGWFDYVEDSNGNGTVDSGETDWENASDLGLKVWITEPKRTANLP